MQDIVYSKNKEIRRKTFLIFQYITFYQHCLRLMEIY